MRIPVFFKLAPLFTRVRHCSMNAGAKSSFHGPASRDHRDFVALPIMGSMLLKMLPLDNKSEFRVIVDMPAGTPVEQTAATLHELGGTATVRK